MELIPRIGEIIEIKGFRKGYVAKEVEVTTTQLGNWIAGRSYPRPPKLWKLARVLGVGVEELYEEKNK